MPRVIHFEIHADDPERAVEFYKKVFGWQIDKWGPEDYWLATTGEKGQPGIDGAILNRKNSNTTVNTIEVPSIDEFLKIIEESGGKVIMQKSAIPGIGYNVYCTDTEGNVFGILESDESAK